MFIKFSDKTKKIIVKKGSKDIDKSLDNSEECIYLDESDENNRRLKALRDHDSEDSDESKA